MQRRIDDGEDFLDAVLNIDGHLEERRIVLTIQAIWKNSCEFPEATLGCSHSLLMVTAP